MSSLERRRVAQHTFTHASLINESSAALTNFPTLAVSCIGPACEQASALTHERGHASPQIVNSEPVNNLAPVIPKVLLCGTWPILD